MTRLEEEALANFMPTAMVRQGQVFFGMTGKLVPNKASSIPLAT